MAIGIDKSSHALIVSGNFQFLHYRMEDHICMSNANVANDYSI